MLYEIIVGDWSGDGHSQSERIIFEVSHSKEEIEKAYKNTCKKAKWQLHTYTNGLLKNYEESSISCDILEELKSVGIAIPSSVEYDEEEDDAPYFSPESCACLYLEFAKASLPELEYKQIKFETLVKGIGYGCFY